MGEGFNSLNQSIKNIITLENTKMTNTVLKTGINYVKPTFPENKDYHWVVSSVICGTSNNVVASWDHTNIRLNNLAGSQFTLNDLYISWIGIKLI